MMLALIFSQSCVAHLYFDYLVEGKRRATRQIMRDCGIVAIVIIATLVAMTMSEEVPCPGKVCSGKYGSGCCTKIGLECCPDGLYCVKNATKQCTSDTGSPEKSYKSTEQLKSNAQSQTMKLEAKAFIPSLKDTPCPAGTCEEDGWFCCADNIYCAKTEGDCPNFKKAGRRIVDSTDDCEPGTQCPSGCCEEEGWFCCADGIYCAKTENDCPQFEDADILALY